MIDPDYCNIECSTSKLHRWSQDHHVICHGQKVFTITKDQLTITCQLCGQSYSVNRYTDEVSF